ncbi:hypothetical protein AB6A40_004591 [Gnathostoma spinigerum]|uniref:SelT-like protein n=1 Tax=Gnathostoma spinigerum TaxID=75299 RepID=A0ABD6EME2_9BILA
MVISKFGYFVLGLAVLMSLKDIYGQKNEEQDVDDEAAFTKEFGDDEVQPLEETKEEIQPRDPATSFSAPHTLKDLPPMKFLFCVSCGYRQAYEEFSRVIHEKYPTMKIDGANYPPASWKAILAQVLGISKIALIVTIIMGRDPFASVGRPTPGIVSWALNNKLSACMLLFLISNTFESSLMSTGAFEIYLGNEQVWSKLESGRVPSPIELLQIVDQSMELQGAKISDTFSFER